MKHATLKRSQLTPKRYVEPSHEATEHGAANGLGTVRKWASGKIQDHPVLDGSMQSWKSEHDTENPWRGLSDPGLIVHPSWKRGEKWAKWHWFWE